MADELLSKCVVAYCGEPGRLSATPPEQRVAAVAKDAADELVPRVAAIFAEVYDAEPPLHLHPTPMAIGKAVEDFVTTRHPELTMEAVRAVANRYAFDWK